MYSDSMCLQIGYVHFSLTLDLSKLFNFYKILCPVLLLSSLVLFVSVFIFYLCLSELYKDSLLCFLLGFSFFIYKVSCIRPPVKFYAWNEGGGQDRYSVVSFEETMMFLEQIMSAVLLKVP